MAAATACSEHNFEGVGEGNISLNLKLNTDMTVVSRSVDDDIKAGTMVWISRADAGLVRRYNNLSEVPTAAFPMLSGSYIAEAWAGDSVSASWDKRWFKGREEFTVEAGKTAQVNLVCRIANVGAEVYYQEGLDKYIDDVTMTVGHSRGTLTFEQSDVTDNRRAYFMMPSSDGDLTWAFHGVQKNGEAFDKEGVIENVQPGYLYKLNVTFTTAQTTGVGGAVITVKIVDQEIPMTTEEVRLVAPPVIKGYDFDIAKPITASQGNVDDRTVFVSSAVDISSVIVDIAELKNVAVLGGYSTVQLIDAHADAVSALADLGINFHFIESTVDGQTKEKSLFRINFTDKFTSTLTNGLHTIGIAATDSEGQVSTATVTINVTDASVLLEPVKSGDVGTRSAILRGTVAKDDVESVGFSYRKNGTGDWTYVEGTPGSRALAKGTPFYAELTSLDTGAKYEYKAVSDDFESAVQTFETGTEEQLPNAGFEYWSKPAKAYLLYGDGQDMFWDSGNHGSTMLGDSYNITTPDANVKHSGNYSAMLKSTKVVMALAAGNLFAGKYLETEGTNGVLGWGRPFVSRPKAVRVWVKYNPVKVDNIGNKLPADASVAKGDMDNGIIYMALVDDSTESYNGNAWPCIIRTSVPKLFDKNGNNVIAYGEHVFTAATDGTDMVEITIPLDYRNDKKPSNIIFVASASRYGDYFTGGAGSTMWVDDIEMIYE